MSNRKNISEKIEAAQEEIKQKEARLKLLLNQQKAHERKDRNHRFCKRGGLVEKLLPDLACLSDEQFEAFVDKALLTTHTSRILAGLVPPPPEPAAEPEGDTAIATPANEVQAGGANGDAKTGDSAWSAS